MTARLALLLMAALAEGRGECLPVVDDKILAGDLARLVPVFAAVAPELPLGNAPAPGTRRSYFAAELTRLGRRYGVTVGPGTEACFTRPLETLTRERIAASLQTEVPEGHFEVLEFSRQPVPQGELHFPLSRVSAPPAGSSACLWHGAIIRPGHPDFPVWATVRIQMKSTRVVALETLQPRQPVSARQIREESYEGAPTFPGPSQIVGRVPRRMIAAGATIVAQWLEPQACVARGQIVRAEVTSGSAHLRLEVEAQSAGRCGEVIAFRNPANGKIFRATVADAGRITLITTPRGDTQ